MNQLMHELPKPFLNPDWYWKPFDKQQMGLVLKIWDMRATIAKIQFN